MSTTVAAVCAEHNDDYSFSSIAYTFSESMSDFLKTLKTHPEIHTQIPCKSKHCFKTVSSLPEMIQM